MTPITIGLLLEGEHHGAEVARTGWFARFHRGFEQGFERLHAGYVDLLHMLLTRRLVIPLIAVLVLTLGAVMFVFAAALFPDIDGGQI